MRVKMEAVRMSRGELIWSVLKEKFNGSLIFAGIIHVGVRFKFLKIIL